MSKTKTQFRIALLILVLHFSPGMSLQIFAQEKRSDLTQRSELDQHRLKSSQATLAKYAIGFTPTDALEFLTELLPGANVDDEIEVLIRQLDSDKYDVRQTAEAKLIAKGAKALRKLNTAVTTASPETRVRSRRCIQQIKIVSPSIIQAAIQILHCDDSASGLKAIPAGERVKLLFKLFDVVDEMQFHVLCSAIVKNAGPSSLKLITAGLESENQLLRLACVRSLPKCVSAVQLKEFEKLIVSAEAATAFAAIRSFGNKFPRTSLKRLLRLLDSKSIQNRSKALIMLRRLSGKDFGYSGYDHAAKRKSALKKWMEWSGRDAVEAELSFEKLNLPTFQTPRGFVVSVSGIGATILDMKGDVVRKVEVSLYDAQDCGNGKLLVCERNAGRVSLLDQRTGKSIRSVGEIGSPADAELLDNGNFLVLHGAGKVTEHVPDGKVFREFDGLNNPFDVDRLPNGNTIVADSSNNRLVEFGADGEVVWEKTELAFPNNVFRLEDSRTLYTTYTSGDVVMLGVDSKEQWRTNFEGGTLYSVYCAEGKVYVADGANQKIWVLGIDGSRRRSINVGFTFCDVGFITK